MIKRIPILALSAIAIAFAGFCLLMAFIFFQHDLRGWMPADLRDRSSIVEPIRPGARGFTLAECVPGTISTWEAPRPGDGVGSATLAALSCRSWTGAGLLLLGYGAVVALCFAMANLLRRRS